MIDRSAELDAAYDRLDGQGRLSSAEIWEELGVEPEVTNEDFTVQAVTARAGGELALKAMGAEFRGNPKHGLNKSEWAESYDDPAQAEVIRNGLKSVRQSIEQSRREQ